MRNSRAAALAGALALAAVVPVVAATPAWAVDETRMVTYSERNLWTFTPELNPFPTTAPWTRLETGPAANLGTGSLELVTAEGTTPGRARAETARHNGTRMPAVTELKYDTYISRRATLSSVAPVLTVTLNNLSTRAVTGCTTPSVITPASTSATIYFEPRYQPAGSGAIAERVWQTWPQTTLDQSIWHTPDGTIAGAHDSDDQTAGCDAPPSSRYVTWLQIKENNPNATIGVIGVQAGTTAQSNEWSGFEGNVDEVVFHRADPTTTPGTPPSPSTHTKTTYDFNPSPVLTSGRRVTWANAAPGDDPARVIISLGRGHQGLVSVTGAYMVTGAKAEMAATGTGVTFPTTPAPALTSNGEPLDSPRSQTLTFPVHVSTTAAAGDHTFRVVNPDGTFGVGTFRVTARPIVDAFEPNAFRQGTNNNPVSLRGANFQPQLGTMTINAHMPNNSNDNGGVTFDGVTGTSPSSAQSAVDVTPTAPTGARSVTVANPDGGFTTFSNGIYVMEPGTNTGGSTTTPTTPPPTQPATTPTTAPPTTAPPTTAPPTTAPPTTPAATPSTGPSETGTPTAAPTTSAPAPTQATTEPAPNQPRRTPASIVLNTSHSRVTAGNTPVLTGQVLDAQNRGVPGVTLAILEKSFGESTFDGTARVVSDGEGNFRLVIRPSNQTSYGANVEDGSVRSNVVQIRVNARMEIAAPAASSTVDNLVTVSGQITPGYHNRPIGLAYINAAGRYVYLGQAPTSNGSFAVRAGSRVPVGTYAFVVYMSATQGTDPGARSVRLTVR